MFACLIIILAMLISLHCHSLKMRSTLWLVEKYKNEKTKWKQKVNELE